MKIVHRHLYRSVVRMNAAHKKNLAQTAATNYQQALAKLSSMENEEKF
jgi:hypothetical protein